jgi:hypothetical protein
MVTTGWGKTDTGTVVLLDAVRSQPVVLRCDSKSRPTSKEGVGQPVLGWAHVTTTLVLLPGRTAQAEHRMVTAHDGDNTVK